jgi:hypothetical protein
MNRRGGLIIGALLVIIAGLVILAVGTWTGYFVVWGFTPYAPTAVVGGGCGYGGTAGLNSTAPAGSAIIPECGGSVGGGFPFRTIPAWAWVAWAVLVFALAVVSFEAVREWRRKR